MVQIAIALKTKKINNSLGKIYINQNIDEALEKKSKKRKSKGIHIPHFTAKFYLRDLRLLLPIKLVASLLL